MDSSLECNTLLGNVVYPYKLNDFSLSIFNIFSSFLGFYCWSDFRVFRFLFLLDFWVFIFLLYILLNLIISHLPFSISFHFFRFLLFIRFLGFYFRFLLLSDFWLFKFLLLIRFLCFHLLIVYPFKYNDFPPSIFNIFSSF
jgi:hypothetical protein